MQIYVDVDACPVVGTREQVAGFKNRSTGEFTEVMLIRNQSDLDSFKKMYDLDEVSKELFCLGRFAHYLHVLLTDDVEQIGNHVRHREREVEGDEP